MSEVHTEHPPSREAAAASTEETTRAESPSADAGRKNRRARRNRSIAVLVAICIIGGAAGTWFGGLKYRFLAKRFGVVVPGQVYRSGQSSKWVIGKVLDEHRIQKIIDFNGRDPKDEHQTAEVEAAAQRGIPIVRFQLPGTGVGDIDRYADALETIHRAEQDGTRILVHCAAGTCRTGAAIGFTRLLVHGWSPADTFAEMKAYGYKTRKNRILGEFMNREMRRLAEILVERGVLKQMPRPVPQLEL